MNVCKICLIEAKPKERTCPQCGRPLTTVGADGSQAAAARRQAIDAEAAAERSRARAAERAERRRLAREARDKYYRDRGVKPGPWAWFQVLPDWLQPILVGLALTGPVVLLAALYAYKR
jgi:hypothetical protein